MKKEDFYNEVNCYVEQLKIDFIEFQEVIWKGLVDVTKICDQNQIWYQLAYGSLLGAVRDNGQIPWDYDIDIFVKYSDRKKIINSLERELSSEYYVDSFEKNKNCDSYKIRVVPKSYNALNAHIDIFLLLPAPEDEGDYIKIGKKLIWLSKVRRYKTGNENKYGKDSRFSKLDNILHTILYKCISLKSIDNIYKKSVAKLLKTETQHYMLADRWALSIKIPRKYIDKTTTLEINNNYFRVPEEYENMLILCYGDYKKIYPINQRFEEWYAGCKRIKC